MSKVFFTSLTENTITLLDDFATDCDVPRGEALEFLVLQGIRRVDERFNCDCAYCKGDE